jgi:hypothetical protein
MLFPEEVNRPVGEPTFAAAVAAGPDDSEGYFKRDGWYAVTINAIVERRFTSGDGEETVWVQQSRTKVKSWVVGVRVHVDGIEDTERNRILISNIRGNSEDGYGVLTRAGNWQIASDYDEVVEPASIGENP